MPLQNRNTLRTFFRRGQIPTEANFADLIDSMLNKVDDGLAKTIDEGLTLSPIGTSKKLMSFFKSIADKNPAWSFEIDSGSGNLDINNHLGDSILTLKSEGMVGINTRNPRYALEVNGTAGIQGRLGTHTQGRILADGQWHPILENLNGCYSFEIAAGAGKRRTGKYAVLHAFALTAFGKSNQKIQTHQAYYGTRCNKIELRWRGDIYDCALEMRTRCSYGGDYYVNYYISSLWFDPLMDGSVGADE